MFTTSSAGIEAKNIDTVLPLAEVIMCLGFFSICLLEELLHHCVHPHKVQAPKISPQTEVTSFNGDPETSRTEEKNEAEDKDEVEAENTSAAEATKSAIRTFFVVVAVLICSLFPIVSIIPAQKRSVTENVQNFIKRACLEF